jgi:hypothetical protein
LKNLKESEILENRPIFKTRTFSVIYKHEVILMNDSCQFRAEVDTDFEGDYLSTTFDIDPNLHF